MDEEKPLEVQHFEKPLEIPYGSPKKPALFEAVALNMADNTDAKMEMMTEIFGNVSDTNWLGFNRVFESNLRGTRME